MEETIKEQPTVQPSNRNKWKEIVLRLAHTSAIRALLPVLLYGVFAVRWGGHAWWQGATCGLAGITAYYLYRASKRARLQLSNVIWMAVFGVAGFLSGGIWIPVVGILVFYILLELEWSVQVRPYLLQVILPSFCGWWVALVALILKAPFLLVLETHSRWTIAITLFLSIASYAALAIFRIKRIMILLVMALTGALLF